MEVIFEAIKKFGAEVISAVLFAALLWGYKRSRKFIRQYNRQKHELESLRADVKRFEAELQHNNKALREAEEARQKAESQRKTAEKPKPASTPKLLAMSDSNFLKLCKSSNTAKIEEAIMNGVNANVKDSDGKTALMLATEHYNSKIVQLLRKYGATK